jgi:hypothetical protein
MYDACIFFKMNTFQELISESNTYNLDIVPFQEMRYSLKERWMQINILPS